ncbi:GRIP and coiled-coil domain-containing protein-like [Battus philenor]|uniref:GRIP and coiled-coil domain-containing protein-like n=1 Tax=Battus philenor TaxID=42288 RepID=UPI0035D0E2D3
MLASSTAFHYPKAVPSFYPRTNGYHCKLCDGADCLEMNDVRCEYYREIKFIMEEEDHNSMNSNHALREAVDFKLFSLVDKDNLCLGCITCSCDATGTWNCEQTQRCRAEAALVVDHRVLIQVMENLNTSKINTKFKIKRSINNKVQMRKTEREEGFTSQEISSIINGANSTRLRKTAKADVNTIILNDEWNAATESVESIHSNTTEENDTVTDSDLEFDDLFHAYLNTSANNTNQHLPMLKNHTEDILDPDYMDTPDDNTTPSDFKRTVDKIFEIQDRYLKKPLRNENKEQAKKMIFYANLNKDVSDLSNMDTNGKGFISPRFNGNDIYDRQYVRVVKRQIDSTDKSASKSLNSSRRSIQDLKNNVFDPLNSIINMKRNEIRDLEQMRDNLKVYLLDYIKNETNLNDNRNLLANLNKSYFTIYKMEYIPQIENHLVIDKTSSMNEYLSKLQNDIFEVIRDIVEIQRTSQNKDLPKDLNILIQAMKYYIHKQGKLHIVEEIKKITENSWNSNRKFSIDNEFIDKTPTDIIKEILKDIDRDMPQTDALAPLSRSSKKILKRVINNGYRENFTNNKFLHIRNNISNNLKDVGFKWYKMTRSVASSRLSDRLFSMKLLHLELMRGISKIKDVSASITFAQTRRFVVTDREMIDQYATRISEDLKIINTKVQEIIKQQNDKYTRNYVTEVTPKLVTKKNSFLHQVKKLLQQSKHEIRNIFKSKHTDKEYANPSQGHPIQYTEDHKWQNNFDGVSKRNKRSAPDFNKAIMRIKNIIPGYLRDKFRKAGKSKISKSKL